MSNQATQENGKVIEHYKSKKVSVYYNNMAGYYKDMQTLEILKGVDPKNLKIIIRVLDKADSYFNAIDVMVSGLETLGEDVTRYNIPELVNKIKALRLEIARYHDKMSLKEEDVIHPDNL